MIRFPALREEALDADQLRMSSLATHNGPYRAFLRAPNLWQALQTVRHYLAKSSQLDAMTREAVMLLVARHWQSTAGFAAHTPLAREAGLSEAAIAAIGDGKTPHGLPTVTGMAIECAVALLKDHGLCDTLYARAIDAMGERLLVEVVGLIGFFSTTSLTLNLMGCTGKAPFPGTSGQNMPS
jgi:4-carboxymuconolactone decarboxylase